MLQEAGAAFAADPEWADDLLEPPAVLGVERVSVDGAVLRVDREDHDRRAGAGSVANCGRG